MSWLAKHYDNRARQGDRRDFLRQVGHTERGRSISDSQFQAMLASLRARLEPRSNDVLLDLCCGNGVFTQPLARDVCHAVGVDFSRELIAIAETHHRASNLVYRVQDVKHLDGTQLGEGRKFSRILMHGSLQHFTATEFKALLETVLGCATKDRVLLFGFVPDFDQRAAFRKALKPGLKIRLRRLFGRDLMGKWWQREEISAIGASLGLKAEFFALDQALNGSLYRFDARMW